MSSERTVATPGRRLSQLRLQGPHRGSARGGRLVSGDLADHGGDIVREGVDLPAQGARRVAQRRRYLGPRLALEVLRPVRGEGGQLDVAVADADERYSVLGVIPGHRPAARRS